MKKPFSMIFCLMLIVLPLTTFADSLVCDPQAGVTDYRVVGLDPARVNVSAEGDGSLKYDVAVLAPGSYSGSVEAGARYMLNGVPQGPARWSNPVPFDLTVPGTPAASSGLAVTGQ
jgi:hypothetical protein